MALPEVTGPVRACLRCGYDLRGLAVPVCPECGQPFFGYSDRAREVVAEANRIAHRFLRGEVEGQRPTRWWMPCEVGAVITREQILMALASGPPGIGQFVLDRSGVDRQALVRAIVQRTPRMVPLRLDPSRRLPLDIPAQRMVAAAGEEALSLGKRHVGTEHLLLALVRETEGIVCEVLKRTGVKYQRTRAMVEEVLRELPAPVGDLGLGDMGVVGPPVPPTAL